MGKKAPHLLYAVLDWGMGHAARSIPVIKELLHAGARISLVGEGNSGFLLQSEFPRLPFYTIKGIQVTYPTHLPMSLSMLLQTFHISRSIQREHKAIVQLADEIRPDAIISDNRYGAYVAGLPSVIISHQLSLQAPEKLPWLKYFINKVNHHYLKNFDVHWVPDSTGPDNLTGELSHNELAVKTYHPVYIGPLSRFKDLSFSENHERYEALVILSGPEPQRSRIENLLTTQLNELKIKTLMVCGTPLKNKAEPVQHVQKVPHLQSEELAFHLRNSRYLISRSGHSTLMDLCAVKRSIICIPTPGQTEQEYLARLHAAAGKIVYIRQDHLDLREALLKLEHCRPFELPVNEGLKPVIRKFLDGL
ncbi:MAG: hypothetical protein JNL88_10980 [Bacteroidia bacterium]|nr:hypothetical protein [Bacteroidia bacterium]